MSAIAFSVISNRSGLYSAILVVLGNLFQPDQHYYVGGNTKFFGAVLFRMRREDFGEIKHHGGISPAWPLTYADIEPSYTKAEKIYHVRGEDPTEPPTNGEADKRLIQKLKDVLHKIHCNDKICYSNDHIPPDKLFLDRAIPLTGLAHQCGTVRFGNDPKTSALDVNCRAHDLDNLYVVDASFFISNAAVNPSLTIIANALRVGDLLLERMS